MTLLSLGFADRQTDFDQFSGFEVKDVTMPAVVDGRPVHCIGMEDASMCYDAIPIPDETRLLWLGASQLHSIHDYKPGDQVAAAYLSPKLEKQGIDLLTFSAANGNFQEFLILFESIRNNVKIDALLIAAVFDDMKEDGVRQEYFKALTEPATVKSLQRTAAGQRILSEYGELARGMDNTEATASQKTLQDTVERILLDYLKQFSLWALRPEAQGWAKVGMRYLRDKLLMISEEQMIAGAAPTLEIIPQSTYSDNIQAYKSLLESAQNANIPVLVYLAPRPMKTFFPYDLDHYDAFQRQIAQLATRFNAHYVNIEMGIPDDGWGHGVEIAGVEYDRDIFHCEGLGHVYFANSLHTALKKSGILEEVGGK